jgi:hypothetical protein
LNVRKTLFSRREDLRIWNGRWCSVARPVLDLGQTNQRLTRDTEFETRRPSGLRAGILFGTFVNPRDVGVELQQGSQHNLSGVRDVRSREKSDCAVVLHGSPRTEAPQCRFRKIIPGHHWWEPLCGENSEMLGQPIRSSE